MATSPRWSPCRPVDRSKRHRRTLCHCGSKARAYRPHVSFRFSRHGSNGALDAARGRPPANHSPSMASGAGADGRGGLDRTPLVSASGHDCRHSWRAVVVCHSQAASGSFPDCLSGVEDPTIARRKIFSGSDPLQWLQRHLARAFERPACGRLRQRARRRWQLKSQGSR